MAKAGSAQEVKRELGGGERTRMQSPTITDATTNAVAATCVPAAMVR